MKLWKGDYKAAIPLSSVRYHEGNLLVSTPWGVMAVKLGRAQRDLVEDSLKEWEKRS